MKIQRADPGEGDAKGLDYLMIWTGEPGCSPIWSTKEKAQEFEPANADEIMIQITANYGYPMVAGSNENLERNEILERMKTGELQREIAIQMLRDLQPRNLGTPSSVT